MEKTEFNDPKHRLRQPLTDKFRIHILLKEYKALYGLLTFRLTAMDRRLPTAGGAIGALLGGTTAMPADTKLAFLLGLPVAVLWLLLSTVQHAKSKEDHLCRIGEIERLVNRLAGEELLVFQSRHPNRGEHPSGRTGFSTVLAVFSVCLIMIAVCGYLAVNPEPLFVPTHVNAYISYIALCAGLMLIAVVRLSLYRYRRPPVSARPIFEPHFLERS